MMIYEFYTWTADWEINARRPSQLKTQLLQKEIVSVNFFSFKFTERKQIVFAI